MKFGWVVMLLWAVAITAAICSGRVSATAELTRIEAGQAAFRESLAHAIVFDGPVSNSSEQPQDGVLSIYPYQLNPYLVREACARSLLGVYMNQYDEGARGAWIRRAKRDCPRSVAR